MLWEIFGWEIKKRFGSKKICVHAQKQAMGFYEKMGFVAVSDEYIEEKIVHITMEKYIWINTNNY